MKKNLLITLTVMTLAFSAITCNAATQQQSSDTATQTEKQYKDNHKKGNMAKVTAVSADSITVAKAEMPERPEGTAPEKPEGTAPEKPEGTAPEKPEGTEDKTSERPEMTFSTETTTISLSDIELYTFGENHEKTEISYSDISEGDMVNIEYAEDGTTVSSISKMTAPNGDDKGERGPGEGKHNKGTMAKVTAVSSSSITVAKAEMPEKPENSENSENSENKPDKTEKPEMTFSTETTDIDLTNVKIYTFGENHQKTEISYSDISEGDMVNIEYAEDGTTVSSIDKMTAPEKTAEN